MSDELFSLNGLRATAAVLAIAGVAQVLIAYPFAVGDGGAAVVVGLGLAELGAGIVVAIAALVKAWSSPSTRGWRPRTDWEAEHGPLASDAPLWISGSGREQWAREQRALKAAGRLYFTGKRRSR